MDWIAVFLHFAGAFLAAVTALPMWRTTHWWARLWDFPRFQIAVLALVLLAVTLIFRPPEATVDWLLPVSMLVVALWQLTWIFPYLPGTPRAMKTCARGAPARACVSLMTTNVLQENRSADPLIAMVADASPDVFLAIEVDEWWEQRLMSGLGARYVHTISYPLSNGYGLTLFSRLELIEPEVRFVLDEAIPSIRTGIKLRSGVAVDVYGVHPRPPSVLRNSTERDIELMRIAREIEARGVPAIVLGDLNDVAWSPTTKNFMRAGKLLDPRRGRGFFNTYPARWPGMRYPLDYIFSTRHFRICTMRVLPTFGSDHLPLIAELELELDG